MEARNRGETRAGRRTLGSSGCLSGLEKKPQELIGSSGLEVDADVAPFLRNGKVPKSDTYRATELRGGVYAQEGHAQQHAIDQALLLTIYCEVLQAQPADSDPRRIAELVVGAYRESANEARAATASRQLLARPSAHQDTMHLRVAANETAWACRAASVDDAVNTCARRPAAKEELAPVSRHASSQAPYEEPGERSPSTRS